MQDILNFKNKTKNVRILFIDDDKLAREATYALLNSIVGLVMCAESGEEGLEIYQRYALQFFDVIITDITMENMNGLEMVEEIKKFNPNQKTVVISAHREYKSKASILRIDGYIVKPLSLNQILETLVDVLELD